MTEEENRQLVAYVRSLGRSQPAQVPGDRAIGERLVWYKGNCGQCHTAGARGGHMGPDLTEIGARRSQAHLRTSLLAPVYANPVSYEFNGRQYIAITAGRSLLTFTVE